MSIPYEATGRTSQKARTRAALIAAARELLTEGVEPTVERTASRAGISRTTAFRYFPNQRALLLGAYPELEWRSLLGDDAASDPMERLERVISGLARQILDHEHELRAMLRLSLASDAEVPLRTGRALAWVEDALAPLEGTLDVRRLALAIRAAIGIEPFVWLTGVGGLGREEAVALMQESARALLREALRDLRG